MIVNGQIAFDSGKMTEARPGRILYGPAHMTRVTASTMQPSEADAVRQLTGIQQQLAKAWLVGDRATIERIIAPEWNLTGPDARISTRADVLRDAFETRSHRIIALTVDDVGVRIFSNAAVVTGRTHGRGEFGKTAYDVVIRFTDMFVHRHGQWQAVASHASLLTAK